MKNRTHPSHRILALLLTFILAMSLLPTSAFAGQADEYHDPAEHWLNAGNRTNELDANAVITVQGVEWHIRSSIHRLRVILEARQLGGIGNNSVQFIFLAHGSRIERGFHRPIMTEGHIILSPDR